MAFTVRGNMGEVEIRVRVRAGRCVHGYVRRQGPRGMYVEKWKWSALHRGRQDSMLYIYTEHVCVKEPREHKEGEGMLYTEACTVSCSIQKHVHWEGEGSHDPRGIT